LKQRAVTKGKGDSYRIPSRTRTSPVRLMNSVTVPFPRPGFTTRCTLTSRVSAIRSCLRVRACGTVRFSPSRVRSEHASRRGTSCFRCARGASCGALLTRRFS